MNQKPVSKPLTLVFLDFETFWSMTHTLSKMAPMQYVMHPDTELISLAARKSMKGDSVVTFGEDRIKELASAVDWSDKFVIGHNMSGFDSLIMAFRLGIKPAMWGCTFAMARSKYSKTVGLSLAKLVEHFKLGVKNNAILNQTKGRHLVDFTPEELAGMAVYNKDDTDQCAELFKCLVKEGISSDELRLIDLTIRMRTEPQFVLDVPMLEDLLIVVRQQSHDSLISLAREFGLNVVADDAVLVASIKKVLGSAKQFQLFLERRLGWCPMKKSPTTGKAIPAISKTDDEFMELLDHDDPLVAMAAQARLDLKANLLETRIVSLLRTAAVSGGMLPVPLKYNGADTTGRWCLTGDHEVLTAEGWVRLDAWAGQATMQWDAASGDMSWCGTTRVSNFAVDEDLYSFDSDYHKAVYTGEHRVPCTTHRGTRIVDVTARTLAGLKRRRMVVSGSAMHSGVDVPDVQLQLTVAMHADGYNVHDSKNNMVRFRFVKQRKVSRLCGLLDTAGITYKLTTYPSEPHVTAVIIRGADAPEWLRDAKTLPMYLYSLNVSQARVVVNELQHWDGCMSGPNTVSWSGKDKDAATKYATVAHLCGKRAKLSVKHRPDEGWVDSWGLSITDNNSYYVMGEHATKVPHKGLVYCPTVSTGYFLCRREGTVFVTGNSGEEYNCQNFPRINPSSPKLTDALRMSLMAPPGKKVVVADLSGIELRVNHFLWKVPYSMAMWRDKPDADLYRTAGALAYGCTFDEVTKAQRQGEKTKALGLGFGAGLIGYTKAARTMGGLILNEDEATKDIKDWRGMHLEIVKGWKRCQSALRSIVMGEVVAVDPWGLVMTCPEGLLLPSGRKIHYPELREEPAKNMDGTLTGRTEWWYGQGRHKARIYSGKIDENIVQAIARDVVAYHLLEFLRHPRVVAMGITVPALLVHDEIVFIANEEHAEEALEIMLDTMKRSPPWWPDIVLWAEGDIGDRYGEAK